MPKSTPIETPDPLPRHVAIIMDGNGRWARARGLPRSAGHKQGAGAVRRVTTAAAELGLECLTLFAFSSENWTRPAEEVEDLMRLLKHYLKNELKTLKEHEIRLRVIGERKDFSEDIVKLLNQAEQETKAHGGMQLIIALNYGGRGEIVRAAQALAVRAVAHTLDPAEIDETIFAKSLFTADLPDPDLLIRTSGEMRLSNFLLWQCAYTEFWFTDKYWPEFTKADLLEACTDYARRERRYGRVGSPDTPKETAS